MASFRIAAGLVVVVVVGGCGAGPAAKPAPQAAPGVTRSAVRGDPGRIASPRPSPEPPWQTGAVRVARSPSVLPLPVVAGVRYAAHAEDGYDRIVVDVDGPALPGYDVGYVSEVRRDGSGEAVPGRHFLLVRLEPAVAHRDDGEPTVTGVHRLDFAALRAYAMVGDGEGVVSIALGVDERVPYRVGWLPGRIFVDVSHSR